MIEIDKAKWYNPDPSRLRALIAETGLSQREVARRLGIHAATFRKYLLPADRRSSRRAPYLLQVALEAMAEGSRMRRATHSGHTDRWD